MFKIIMFVATNVHKKPRGPYSVTDMPRSTETRLNSGDTGVYQTQALSSFGIFQHFMLKSSLLIIASMDGIKFEILSQTARPSKKAESGAGNEFAMVVHLRSVAPKLSRSKLQFTNSSYRPD